MIEPVHSLDSLKRDDNSGDIEISLKRVDYSKIDQSIAVHLTIVDSLKLWPLYATKEIRFMHYLHKYVLLRTTKKQFFGCFGLNKLRFIPNDILTVKCEIFVYENFEERYLSEEDLEDTSKYAKHKIIKYVFIPITVWVVIRSCLNIFLRYVK